MSCAHLVIQQRLEQLDPARPQDRVRHERVYLAKPLSLYSASYDWNCFEGHRVRISAVEWPHKNPGQAAGLSFEHSLLLYF